jgi:undecaprenyl-diphosphatase
MKNYYGRPRPAGEALTFATGYSFPSGHSMVSMAFYGYLSYLAWSRGGRLGKMGAAGLWLLIILIGVSRVYLNVHYPTDVLGGWIFGFIIVAVTIKVMKRLSHKH